MNNKLLLKTCMVAVVLMILYYLSWVYNLKIDVIYENMLNRKWNASHRKLLILVTSWKMSKEKRIVHTNTGRLWSLWPNLVQPVAYVAKPKKSDTENNEDNIDDMQIFIQHGWCMRPIPKLGCGRVPILKSMLLDALALFKNADFYGFANSDILFDNGLIETLQSIKQAVPTYTPLLVIGRRTNVNFTGGRTIYRLDDVGQAAKSGFLMKGIAIDYFITNRMFPWHLLPDLVVGRIHYDNWMIYFSVSVNITVIDATNTVTAVHQTTTDGNAAGWKHANVYCNKKVIGKIGKPFRTRWGYTWCAPHFTYRDSTDNKVVIQKRNVTKSCIEK